MVAVLVVAAGCRQQARVQQADAPDRHARIFDSGVLDALLTAAPQTLVNLGALPEEVWHTDMELGQPKDSMVLTHPFMFVIARDSLYFANFRNAIYAAGFDGVLRRQIGRRGRAPGEFNQLSDFGFSGSHFFVGDASRIQVLSSSFEYVAAIAPQKGAIVPGKGMVVAANRLYTQCARGLDFRVCPFSTEPPFEKAPPFLPALGITNPSLDGIEFGVTSDGQRVFVGYTGLPYVFVFDENHEHLHTIRLVGEPVNAHADNYTMSRPGVPGTGLRIFLSNIHVLNDEYLAIPIKDLWHFIKIHGEDDFEHVGTARLIVPSENGDNSNAIVGPGQALVHDGHLYVYAFRAPHLLRYPFPY